MYKLKYYISKAICQIHLCSTHEPIGIIYFEEANNNIRIKGQLNKLPPGPHGFHIHESANLKHCCASLKGHFNPNNKIHGGPNSEIRHVGDLGNIIVGDNGECIIDFEDTVIKLNGINSIVGRSVVIHEDEDDLGMGGDKESLITGNAGKRIAYGIIGIDA